MRGCVLSVDKIVQRQRCQPRQKAASNIDQGNKNKLVRDGDIASLSVMKQTRPFIAMMPALWKQ